MLRTSCGAPKTTQKPSKEDLKACERVVTSLWGRASHPESLTCSLLAQGALSRRMLD